MALWWKETCNLRHSMHLCHPASEDWQTSYWLLCWLVALLRISGSCAERDLQLKVSYASLPPCIGRLAFSAKELYSQSLSCGLVALCRKRPPMYKAFYASLPRCIGRLADLVVAFVMVSGAFAGSWLFCGKRPATSGFVYR